MARMPDRLPQVMPSSRVGGVRMPGADVSSGVQQVARTLQAVVQEREADAREARDRDDRLAMSRAETQFRASEMERLISEGDALSDDAIEGFTDRFSSGTDAAAKAALSNLPERIHGQAQAVFADTQAQMRLRAFDIEHDRRVDRQQRLLGESVANRGAIVFGDATQYDAMVAAGLADIEASNLPQGAQAAARSELPRALADQRMLGLVDSEPALAVRELESGQWNDRLTAPQIARHLDAARRELDRRRAEAERAAAAYRARRGDQLRQLIDDDLASRLATGVGVNVSLSEVERVLGGEAAARFEAARSEASENHEYVRRFSFDSPAQIERDVRALAPRPGQEGFEAAQRRHAAIAEIAEDVLTQRREDPAAAAIASDPVLAQSMQDLMRPGLSDNSRRIILRTFRETQQRLGIAGGAQRLTTNAQAAALAASVRDAAPNERAAALERVTAQLEALYGAEGARALAEVARVADAPELGALAGIAEPQARRRVARAMGAPEADVNQNAARSINAIVDEELARLAASLADTPGAAERLSTMRAAAIRTARGDVAAGANASTAARAAARLYTQAYQFQGTVRLPRQWNGRALDARRVMAGAQARLDALIESGRANLPAGNAGDGGRGTRLALSHARWVSAPNDRGLMLVDREFGDAISGPNGAPIMLSWDDALAEVRTRDDATLQRQLDQLLAR